jgi:hypothetical protein
MFGGNFAPPPTFSAKSAIAVFPLATLWNLQNDKIGISLALEWTCLEKGIFSLYHGR